jgi:fluoride exporter
VSGGTGHPAPRSARVIALYIGLGGALGALGRFALSGWVVTWAGAAFPWGTFATNVAGSSLLGYLTRARGMASASPGVRAFLTVGLCGGFTTFSTFDLETLVLLQHQRFAVAAAYSLGSVAACIGGIVGGRWLAARRDRAGALQASEVPPTSVASRDDPPFRKESQP